MKHGSRKIRVGFGVSLLAASVFAVSTNGPARPATRVTTDYIDARISLSYPGFEGLSVDSLGKERFPLVTLNPPAKPWQPARTEVLDSRVEYRRPGAADSTPARWAIEIRTNEICLESHWSADDPPEPLVLNADTSVSHVTLLGLVETNGSIRLPAVMHFPDQGSFQISANPDPAGPLGYSATRKNVKITFPAATREHPALTYRLKVAAIHPKIPGMGDFQGFGDNKKSKDWRTWNGECHGYEGLLNDNYYALLAVLGREAALKKNAANSARPASRSTRMASHHDR